VAAITKTKQVCSQNQQNLHQTNPSTAVSTTWVTLLAILLGSLCGFVGYAGAMSESCQLLVLVLTLVVSFFFLGLSSILACGERGSQYSDAPQLYL